jgi:hypothetical protein
MNKQDKEKDNRRSTMNSITSRNLMLDAVEMGRQETNRSNEFAATRSSSVPSRSDMMYGRAGLGFPSSDSNMLSTSLGDLSLASLDCDIFPKDSSIFHSRDGLTHIPGKGGADPASNEICVTELHSDHPKFVQRVSDGPKIDWDAMYCTAVSGSSSRTKDYQRDVDALHQDDADAKQGEASWNFRDSKSVQECEAYPDQEPTWNSNVAAAGGDGYSDETASHPFGDVFSSGIDILVDSSTHSMHHDDGELLEGSREVSFPKYFDPRQKMNIPKSDDVDDSKPKARDFSNNASVSSGHNTDQSVNSSEKRSRKIEPAVRLYVDEITDCDVLFGRGGKANHHPGNQFYLDKIKELKPLYAKCERKSEKTKVAQSVVDFINHEQKGNFLEMDEETGRWFIAANKAARTKASQALRDDNTAESRAKKRQKYGC